MLFSHFAPVAFSSLLLSSFPVIQALSIYPRQSSKSCNGSPDLCDRSYGNITFVGSHDSYAIGSVSNLFVNQDQNITQQLNDGIRMLQVQAHNNSGTIQLCHTSCSLLNGGTLESYLTTVKTWMDANPNDVVTLLMVNIDDLPMSMYASVFESTGMGSLAYSPPSANLTNTAWPTLNSLINNGTRLVAFVDTKADYSTVPYIIDEFTNVWETAYDVTDTTFDCNVNRTQGDTSSQLYLINHFLDQVVLGSPAPDASKANVTNGVSGTGSLGLQTNECAAQYNRYPNFLLVDFYEYGGGSVFEVAASANGVTYSPSTPIATPKPTSSSSTTSSHAVPRLALNRGSLFASLTAVTGVVLGVFIIL